MKISTLSLLSSICALASAETFRLQSWNLRFDSKKDGISISDTLSSLNATLPDENTVDWYGDYKEVSWSKRRIGIANDVIFNGAHIFTVNEGLQNQIEDLKELLTLLGDGDEWDYVGVGRNDGKTAGEYEAIFYNKDKVSLNDSYTIWLSNTPLEPSKYPGSGSYRSSTIGHFEINGSPLTIINTHLDDKSEDERKLGASILRYLGGYEYINSEGPVFLVGDFNSHSTGSTSGGYQISTGLDSLTSLNSTFAAKYASSISTSFTWSDLLVSTDVARRSGHYSTFTGFKAINDTSVLDGRIDFQFVGVPNSNAKSVPIKTATVLRHRVGEIFYDNEWHLSDHRPLIADIEY